MSEAVQTTLPPKWASANLSEIAAINPPLDRCLVSDDVPVDFVPMRAVQPEGGGLLRPEVASYGKVKKGYTAFLSGDVIMAKITPCMENGKICVVPVLPGAACFGSTEFHVLRAESGIEARWIANYLLQHSTRYAAQRQMAGGVGQMRVPASFLETLAMPVPPESEQVRILDTLDELLSDLDAGVATLERVRAKLKHYRAAVLKAAVEGALTAEWRRQNPATEAADVLLTRILAERRRRWEEAQLAKFEAAGRAPSKEWKTKHSEPRMPNTVLLSALPQGWVWVSAQQLSWASGYGTSEKCSEANKGLAVLRIPNVVGGGIDLTNLKFARPDYQVPAEELVAFGDLLIVRTNGSRTLIGRGAVVRGNPACPLSFASYLIRLRLVPYVPVLGWIAVLWESPSVRQWIEARAATSAGQHNVSLSVLERMPIPLPPEAEQAAIVEAVEAQLSVIDHLERDLDTRLTSAQALRQSILRHAFAGQLVPQDPNDESASELLKRIGAEREERARLAQAAKQANRRIRVPSARARKK